MESGRGPESSHLARELTESGFSEKKSARVREGKGMDSSQIKKRKPATFPPKQKILKRAARTASSQRERILAAYDHNEQALNKLIKTLGVLAQGSFDTPDELVTQIRARHKIQEELLNALVLESRGELREDTLSKELQDLVK